MNDNRLKLPNVGYVNALYGLSSLAFEH